MPERFTNRIMRLLRNKDYQPLKQRALAHSLRVNDQDYDAFRLAIKKLHTQGDIIIGPGSKICLPALAGQVTGTFESTSKGFGFVRPDKPLVQGDLFIPEGQSLDAITGDKVLARVIKQEKRGGLLRYSGRIVEILSREKKQFVGRLFQEDRQWFVQPDGKAAAERIAVGDPGAKNAKAGDKVVVEIIDYPTAEYFAYGVITERLGKCGVSTVELKAILHRYNLPDKFPAAVLEEARHIAHDFLQSGEAETSQREDISHKTVITIDPVDARDFDDAISLRKLPSDHWQLGVHIADVSTFVKNAGLLDEESRLRANSVYLPQHVIPMLPEVLSNGLCSLQEGQKRLVKSAYINFDKHGKVLGARFANSIITSTCRLTYEDADDIIAGKTAGFSPKVIHLLKEMEQLAHILQRRRDNDGMLTLDLPKAQLVYDQHGHVIDAHPESRTFSHTIIEMFMLEANEAVARLLDSLRVPFLRRVHAEPDSLAVGQLARVLKDCGFNIPQTLDRKDLQKLLSSAQGTPQSFIINLAVLKSMQQAEYSPAAIGHYALASEHYCHFTSPIRRYPDLAVHRLLDAYITGRLTRKTIDNFPDYENLLDLGKHCSERERNAENAERELTTLKILQMLSNHIGEDRLGVVTSITNFGLFVQLEKFLVDGLISAEDVYRYESRQSNRRKKKPAPDKHSRSSRFIDRCPFRIGQEIRVRIAAVNVAARTLDLVPCPV